MPQYMLRAPMVTFSGRGPRRYKIQPTFQLTSGQAQSYVRDKYRALYELPVVEYGNGSRSFHDGWLYRCHGLNVLFLRGDVVEMAFQHGRLLADQIPQGTVPQSAKLVRNAIASTHSAADMGFSRGSWTMGSVS